MQVALSKPEHWRDDCLDRWKVASDFSKIILDLPAKENEAWVICVDAPYGAGKSFVVERWRKDLEQKEFNACSLFYNSWEFDYSDDAFISFSAEIIDQLASRARSGLDEMKEVVQEMAAFYRLAWPLLRYMNGLPEVSLEEIEEIKVIKEVTQKAKAVGNMLAQTTADQKKQKLIQPDLLEIHRQSKAAVDLFKEFLKKAANVIQKRTGKPLIIFVDEIDRCKPTFAIRLLERIKHVFNVPNIVFVVMTNKKSLAQSVKAVYGQSFASEEYLERFFDIPLTLPIYDPKAYVGSMFPAIFQHEEEQEEPALVSSMAAFFELCASALKLNLREKKKALEFMRLALPAFPYKDAENSVTRLLLSQFIFVCCLRISSYTEVYNGLGDTLGDYDSFFQSLHRAVVAKSSRDLWHKTGKKGTRHLTLVMESLYFNYNSYDGLRAKLNNLSDREIDEGEFVTSILVGAINVIGANNSRITKYAQSVQSKGRREYQASETTFALFIRRHVDYIERKV